KSGFIDSVKRADGDAAEIGAAHDAWSNTVTAGFDEIAANSTGPKAEVFTVLSAYTKEATAQAKAWRDAFDAAMAPEILDLERLMGVRDYQAQLDTLARYTEATRTYQ